MMTPPLLLVLLAGAPPLSRALERVVLVSRHGERERLFKHHTSLAEHTGMGGPPLTQRGVEHVARVGAALRARYILPETCSQTETCLMGTLGTGGFAAHELHAESSGLARTLSTASVLLDGLVPPSARRMGGAVAPAIPVYSGEEREDMLLRGYAKCPALSSRIQAWHGSAEFARKSAETAPLRAEVGSALGAAGARLSSFEAHDGTPVPLSDWFNAHESLRHLHAPVPPATLVASERLVAWLESHKFGMKNAGSLCGGALLGDVARRLDASDPAPSLVYYSAHYPTLLCLLGAANVSVDSGDASDGWLQQRLLPTGSVLAFELSLAPQPTVTLSHFELPADAPPASLGAWRVLRRWPLRAVQDWATRVKPDGAADWCVRCANTEASACRAALLDASTLLANSVSEVDCLVRALLVFFLTALGFACCVLFHRRLYPGLLRRRAERIACRAAAGAENRSREVEVVASGGGAATDGAVGQPVTTARISEFSPPSLAGARGGGTPPEPEPFARL